MQQRSGTYLGLALPADPLQVATPDLWTSVLSQLTGILLTPTTSTVLLTNPSLDRRLFVTLAHKSLSPLAMINGQMKLLLPLFSPLTHRLHQVSSTLTLTQSTPSQLILKRK